MRFYLPVLLLSILFCLNFSESFGQITPVAQNDTVSITNNSVANEVVYIEVDFLENDKFSDDNGLKDTILSQTNQYGKMYLIENDRLMIYYPYENSFGTDTIHYQICNDANKCSKAFVVVNVIDPNQVELLIPSSFTPNNDGANEKFYIKGIENYPENQFIVFSRWGTKVFEKKNYTNDDAWDGGYNKAGAKLGPGDKLPKGTYFFKLIISDKQYVKSGYIVIKY
ncbi:MAG: gliding motility-associated C-terminal domain-containing protein [Labilibaculum antarcticum]